MNSRLRLPALLFLGSLLMQTAWILALPPFRGSDEFDHAYKAAAVAGGQWSPSSHEAKDGRGDLLVVPRSIVEAASLICRSYKYTGHDNCHPVEGVGADNVTVASAAARYNPVFYWIIGTPAIPFDGAHALYVMRIVGAILCSAFIALAGWTLSLWARTRWPFVASLVAMTPVLIYSTAVAAPNGLEMCAALALWAVVLGLARPNLSREVQTTLLYAAIPSAVVLAGVRTMGPLWVVLIVISGLALVGLEDAKTLGRRHGRQLVVVSTVITVATFASIWWILEAAPNKLEGQTTFPDPLANTLPFLPLWLFQSIAAFPLRNEVAPTIVYATELFLFLVMIGAGFRLARRRLRLAIAGTMLFAIGVPFVLTLMTYSHAGPIWQGRYGMPYSVGVILLAGLALEEADIRHRLIGPVLLAGWAALVVAQSVGVANVLVQERLHSPLSGDSSWMMPQPWMVVALVILGAACWSESIRRRSLSNRPAPMAELEHASVDEPPVPPLPRSLNTVV